MKRTDTTSGEGDDREALAPGLPASGAVLLQVYLWTDGAASEPDVPPPAFAMVADLLQVRGGDLRNPSVGSIAASFGDTALATSAARNVQRLLQGFARAWQGGALGGCSVLTRADESGDDVDVASLRGDPALTQAHPGQIFFVGRVCETARSIPGLEFRAMPGLAGKTRQALHLLPPTHMDGYVDEPFVPRTVASVVPAAIEVAAIPVAQRPPAYVLPSSPPSGKIAAVTTSLTPAVPLAATRDVLPATGDEIGAYAREGKQSGGTARWAIVGGIGAVAVASVLIFTPLLRKSPQPAASPGSQPSPASSAPAIRDEAPPPAHVLAAPVKTTPNDLRVKPAVHTDDAVAAPVVLPTAEPEPEPAPAEDIRPAHGLTFTPAEITSLIAHADKDSGDGNFDKAIQEYKLVLSREPANDLAKRGLARAEYNKEHK